MTTDTALIEKREELKRQLAAGEYKTLIDVFLEWFDRLIRKITRQSNPLPIWLITVILIFIVNLITSGASYVTGDSTNVVESFGLGYGLVILTVISLGILPIITVIVINQSIHRVFVLWRDYILDATESITSLQEFEDWLKKVCNRRLHSLIAIFVGLLTFLFMMAVISTLMGVFPGYGFTFGLIIGNMSGSAFYYQLAMVLLLPMMLRRYDLKLFAADPATSEHLSRLSSELGFIVSFIAFYATFITLFSVAGRTFSQASSIILVMVFWLPMIVIFVLNQNSLSSLVRRAKWKTLNEIQAKIEKLQAAENLEAKETLDAINQLLDYHERVNKTRTSALDFRAFLNFISQLLLPLLAFLLGNLDKVLSLFARQP